MKRIFIANRGEIATRIIRTAKRLGIETAVGVLRSDKHFLFANQATLSCELSSAADYLDINKMVNCARELNCDAIHPGYGFLSERAAFAQACREVGLTFIGPPAEVMRIAGSKVSALAAADRAGLATLPRQKVHTTSEAKKFANEAGYPILIKAEWGGGGRGHRLVENAGELVTLIAEAQDEARSGFGVADIFLEKYATRVRHIEVQIAGDAKGNLCHFFERECSVQRRFQKILEEAPSPTLSHEDRELVHSMALKLAKEIVYQNLGTVEFLFTPGRKFYFMEINARLQVEHPVTEAITGLDLVEQQIRIARGEVKPWSSWDGKIHNHAIELRVCAEDERGQASRGLVRKLHWPNVRVETSLASGAEQTTQFDSLVAKLIVVEADRAHAIKSAREALKTSLIQGLETNLGALDNILSSSLYQTNSIDTKSIWPSQPEQKVFRQLLAHAATGGEHPLKFLPPNFFGDQRYWRTSLCRGEQTYELELTKTPGGLTARMGSEEFLVDNRSQVEFGAYGHAIEVRLGAWLLRFLRPTAALANSLESKSEAIRAPMDGRVVRVEVSNNSKIEKGQLLFVIEAMKMQHQVKASRSGQLTEWLVKPGQQLRLGMTCGRYAKERTI